MPRVNSNCTQKKVQLFSNSIMNKNIYVYLKYTVEYTWPISLSEKRGFWSNSYCSIFRT